MALGKVGIIYVVNAQSHSCQSVYFLIWFFHNTRMKLERKELFCFDGDDQFMCSDVVVGRGARKGRINL